MRRHKNKRTISPIVIKIFQYEHFRKLHKLSNRFNAGANYFFFFKCGGLHERFYWWKKLALKIELKVKEFSK